jgi:hypothetical protein
MHHKPFPLPESPAYHLSDEGHLLLEEMRDHLLFLASLADLKGDDDELKKTLEITREALGESYAYFARQLIGILMHEVKHARAVAPINKKVH